MGLHNIEFTHRSKDLHHSKVSLFGSVTEVGANLFLDIIKKNYKDFLGL